MLKISFWLKKSDTDQGNLEHITIDNPQKVLEGKLAGMYACEIYVPEIGKSLPIYSTNPADALCNASEFAKTWLQGLINRGYTISEIEQGEVWKLAKKDPIVNLQEKIEAIRNDKNISQEGKDKILGVLKDSFGKEPSPIKDQVNKAIGGN